MARLKQILPRAHLEPARNPDALDEYCSKSLTRVGDPVEYGTRPEQGRRSDIDALKQSIKDGASFAEIREQHTTSALKYASAIKEWINDVKPDRREAPTVIILVGPGGVGKSITAKAFAHHNNYGLYIHNYKEKFFQGYEGQEVCLFDEYVGQFDWEYLKQLTDQTVMRVPVKYGTAKWTSRYIYFTSNQSPDSWYPQLQNPTDAYQFWRRVTQYYNWDDIKQEFVEQSIPRKRPFKEPIFRNLDGSSSSLPSSSHDPPQAVDVAASPCSDDRPCSPPNDSTDGGA